MNNSRTQWWDEWSEKRHQQGLGFRPVADRPPRGRRPRHQKAVAGAIPLLRSLVGWNNLVGAVICAGIIAMNGDARVFNSPPVPAAATAVSPLHYQSSVGDRDAMTRSIRTYLSSLPRRAGNQPIVCAALPPDAGALPSCSISLSALHSLPGLSSRYRMPIVRAAHKYGLDPALVMAVVHTESRFNPDAKSHAGAEGLMQLMPKTARAMGVSNRLNAMESIDGGSKYLAKLLSIYDGNVSLALAAYNAGMGQVARYHGIPPIDETQSYVTTVMQLWPAYREAREIGLHQVEADARMAIDQP